MPPRDWCVAESAKVSALLDKRGETAGEVLFGAGFGPSGLPHIGTLCEVMRTGFVRTAFAETTGRPTRLVLVSDDMDALRKVPDGFPNRELLEQHLGLPLHRVPDPFEQHESLSTGINARLRRVLDAFELDYELVCSSAAYASGKYDDTIRSLLADLAGFNELVGASVGPVRRGSYSILMPVSASTGRVIEHTRVLEVDPVAGTLTYEIPADVIIQRPGLDYGIEPQEYYAGEPIGEPVTVSALGGACKLQWKADWAMRLLAGGVAYEMHGEDLAASAQVVRRICHRLRREPPVLFGYGLFTDERGHKISKSRGNGFSLTEAQDYLSQEALRLLLYRKPRRPKRFGPALTPRLNDAVRQEARRAADPERGAGARVRLHRIGATARITGPGFGKLCRVLDACAPVDFAAAVEFARRYFGDGIEHETLVRAWNFHEARKPVAEPRVFAPAEAALLERAAEVIELAPPAELAVRLHLLLTVSPLGRPAACRVLYLALLGRPHGPRLATWIRITGPKRSLRLLRETLAR
ncbi:hypothetical protein M8C13_04690 [Crossiella sp. SN42]|uniref:hypothetical protein n=1 Tax=Crossiella sp. SN42 TaxID=2944808 RepID=UPI00207C2496|nr:hypothetical protein [Crossiella sp. SN42]MCO1575056.1 hypothetical protein [Crossiella sp. SN42]